MLSDFSFELLGSNNFTHYGIIVCSYAAELCTQAFARFLNASNALASTGNMTDSDGVCRSTADATVNNASIFMNSLYYLNESFVESNTVAAFNRIFGELCATDKNHDPDDAGAITVRALVIAASIVICLHYCINGCIKILNHWVREGWPNDRANTNFIRVENHRLSLLERAEVIPVRQRSPLSQPFEIKNVVDSKADSKAGTPAVMSPGASLRQYR